MLNEYVSGHMTGMRYCGCYIGVGSCRFQRNGRMDWIVEGVYYVVSRAGMIVVLLEHFQS